MEEKNTPRTDKVASLKGNWDTKALRMTGFAENLERELAELRELFSKSLKERESTEKEVNAMLERVIAAEKQRDALAEALDYIAHCGLSARHLANYAKTALAAVKGGEA
jgi:hypothetical protein